MRKKTYYMLYGIATGVALLLMWLADVSSLDNPITYLYIGFNICLLVLYYLLRHWAQRRKGTS